MTKLKERPAPEQQGNGNKSLLDRLSQILSREPTDREQLLDMLRDAHKRTLIGADVLDMVEGVFQVTEMQVRDIMIPRAQMAITDANKTPEENLATVIETAHSRFPMVDGDKDKVLGILLAKDLLLYFQHKIQTDKPRIDIDDILRPPVFVPESKRLNVLLQEFRTNRNHMAIVVNEHGDVSGLVTIEDVLEQIVGEIEDEHDIDDEGDYITPRKHGEFNVRALTPIKDFNAFFKVDFNNKGVDTIGGLVTNHLGRMPKRGEEFDLDGFRFKVLRSGSRRVYLLKVTPLAESNPQSVA